MQGNNYGYELVMELSSAGGGIIKWMSSSQVIWKIYHYDVRPSLAPKVWSERYTQQNGY